MGSLRTATNEADLPPVTDEQESRGAAIERRFNALGIADRKWMDLTGIDIKTVKRAIAGDPRVRPSSYLAIESELERLEGMVAGEPTAQPDDDGTGGLVEFRLSGNFGVDVVVKGPISDRAALEESVTRLIREMRKD